MSVLWDEASRKNVTDVLVMVLFLCVLLLVGGVGGVSGDGVVAVGGGDIVVSGGDVGHRVIAVAASGGLNYFLE